MHFSGCSAKEERPSRVLRGKMGDADREIPGEYLQHWWDLWLIQGVLGGENISEA